MPSISIFESGNELLQNFEHYGVATNPNAVSFNFAQSVITTQQTHTSEVRRYYVNFYMFHMGKIQTRPLLGKSYNFDNVNPPWGKTQHSIVVLLLGHRENTMWKCNTTVRVWVKYKIMQADFSALALILY
jgi:hypothetical protein